MIVLICHMIGSPDPLLIKNGVCRIVLREKPFWRYSILDPGRMRPNAMRSAKCRENHMIDLPIVLLDNNLRGHRWVDRAVIRVGARRRELM